MIMFVQIESSTELRGNRDRLRGVPGTVTRSAGPSGQRPGRPSKGFSGQAEAWELCVIECHALPALSL